MAALTLKNVGGVFVCLMCGMALAVIQSCLEFVWAVRQQAAEENVRLHFRHFTFLLRNVFIQAQIEQMTLHLRGGRTSTSRSNVLGSYALVDDSPGKCFRMR